MPVSASGFVALLPPFYSVFFWDLCAFGSRVPGKILRLMKAVTRGWIICDDPLIGTLFYVIQGISLLNSFRFKCQVDRRKV